MSSICAPLRVSVQAVPGGRAADGPSETHAQTKTDRQTLAFGNGVALSLCRVLHSIANFPQLTEAESVGVD